MTSRGHFRLTRHKENGKWQILFTERFLTNWSGVTSTWRRDLRKRSRRWVPSFSLPLWFDSVWFIIDVDARCVDALVLCLQLLLFLKGFTESERNKLAMLTGILLANGNLSASILNSLFNENLVKEGEDICPANPNIGTRIIKSHQCSRASSWVSHLLCVCRGVCRFCCEAVQVLDQRERHQLGCCQSPQSRHGQQADGSTILDLSFILAGFQTVCWLCCLAHRSSFLPTNGAVSIFPSISPTQGWRSCPTSHATSNPSAPARSSRRSSRTWCPVVNLRGRWVCVWAGRQRVVSEIEQNELTGVFCVQIIAFTKEEMKKANLSEQTMISIIWTSVMSCVEWNKKEELVTEQAIKHLKVPKPHLQLCPRQLGWSGSCFPPSTGLKPKTGFLAWAVFTDFLSSTAIQPSAESLHLPGSVWTQSVAEDPGVLLRQHPLHEGFSEDRGAPLQRCASLCLPVSPHYDASHDTIFLSTADVLSEEAILRWYSDAHLSRGKSVFLEQMKKFVEWLKNAEEGKKEMLEMFWCWWFAWSCVEALVVPSRSCGPLQLVWRTNICSFQSLNQKKRRRTKTTRCKVAAGAVKSLFYLLLLSPQTLCSTSANWHILSRI